jgi:hypothetical protein
MNDKYLITFYPPNGINKKTWYTKDYNYYHNILYFRNTLTKKKIVLSGFYIIEEL